MSLHSGDVDPLIDEPAVSMSPPRVSIITPVFDGEKYLDDAVQSVLRQTFTDWELLLIDDGSRDASVTIAKRYAASHSDKIRYLEHPGHANKGQFATRILGAQRARADVLALLDQDDIWHDDYLEKHLQAWDAAQSHQVCLSYGPGLYWHPDDTRPARDFVQPMPPGSPKVYAPGELLDSFLSAHYSNTPLPSCTLIRREVLGQVKHFENLAKGSPCEDQYLWWYAATRWPVAVHGDAWVRYRQHTESAYVKTTAIPRMSVRTELAFLRAIRKDLSVQCPNHPLVKDGNLAARIKSLETQRVRNAITAFLPEPAKRIARSARTLVNTAGARMRLGVGVQPLSYRWGLDRGLPIHRYYVERFLSEFRANIRGHCLEFQNDSYIKRFGGPAVTVIDVLHIDHSNFRATMVADLTKPNTIPSNALDCIICTHVLHLIPDFHHAVSELYRILKPGGTLLVAVPQVSMYDPGWHEHWRFTTEGLTMVLAKAFGTDNVTTRAYGNSLTAAGELRGVVAHEFSRAVLEFHDPRFAVEICARAVKPCDAATRPNQRSGK